MRYDACVIGAGADGLSAAAMLARAGLKTVVVERGEQPGGRCALREFHPGFRAAPFTDSIAAIPPCVFRALDLARHGLVLPPPQASLSMWPDRAHWIRPHRPSPAAALAQEMSRLSDAAIARGRDDAAAPPHRPLFGRAPAAAPWPGEDLLAQPLAERARAAGDTDAMAHVLAAALEGHAIDPDLRGSAAALLAPAARCLIVPGLAEALAAAATGAGAELMAGAEATEVRLLKDRVAALVLADGGAIETRAVLSTLDLKRTFLTLFAWDALPKPLAGRVQAFRMEGACARLLIALDRPPALAPEAMRAGIRVAPDARVFADAAAAWRAGMAPERPPMTLRVVSAVAPALAPAGKAVLTATLGAIPHRLFDGAWTNERREKLRDTALAMIDAVLPGTRDAVLAAELLVPADIEEGLGATGGDVWGGEIAADQMFAMRPGLGAAAPRTPVGGLYLAGGSTASGLLGAGVSGTLAAEAIAADLKNGRRG
ncbi:MAG TPA: NAD(P)/FAD-dependent oxidoreductase [Rhizomicrobium sp.]|nr:NAD(P)/FAD-dependent oxidoreductase [Rhizomicrobium sp.]